MKELSAIEIQEIFGGAEEKPDFSNVESGFSTTGEVREAWYEAHPLWLF